MQLVPRPPPSASRAVGGGADPDPLAPGNHLGPLGEPGPVSCNLGRIWGGLCGSRAETEVARLLTRHNGGAAWRRNSPQPESALRGTSKRRYQISVINQPSVMKGTKGRFSTSLATTNTFEMTMPIGAATAASHMRASRLSQ